MTRAALLISDNPLSARIGSLLLREAGVEVAVVASRNQLANQLRERGFDLYVIYEGECQNDWLEMYRTLRSEVLNPILVVTTQGTEACALEAYAAGVDEFIFTPLSPALFIAKVRAWLRRSWAVPVDTLQTVQAGPYKLDPARREFAGMETPLVRLTNLEFRVLYLLMTHRERSLSPDFIIERVWGGEQPGDLASLKNVIYRLRRKIESDPEKPSLLLTLPGEGYIFRPGERL